MAMAGVDRGGDDPIGLPHSSGAAKAASVETPTASRPRASAIPRAAATPMRMPVNEPGPTVTAMRSRTEPALDLRHDLRTIGRSLGMALFHRNRRARDGTLEPESSTQTETAGKAVSMARMRVEL